MKNCKFCNSRSIVKYGKTKKRQQKYRCKNCWRSFYFTRFEKNKYNPAIVHHILNSYFMGNSFRKISRGLFRIYKFKVSYQTISHWVKKYLHILELTDVADYEFKGNMRIIDFPNTVNLCNRIRKSDREMIRLKSINNSGGRPPLYLKHFMEKINARGG